MRHHFLMAFLCVMIAPLALPELARGQEQYLEVLSQWNDDGFSRPVAARDTFLFTGSDSSFVVLNVADPSRPEVVSRFPLPMRPYDIVLRGDFAFVSGGHVVTLVVLNVADVRRLHIADRAEPGWFFVGRHVKFKGDSAFVSVQPFGTSTVYDVSDPYAVDSLGNFSSCLNDVVLARQAVYHLACGGIRPLYQHIASWSPLEYDSFQWFEEEGEMSAGAIRDTLLYVVGDGFRIYDVGQDGTFPELLSDMHLRESNFSDLTLANELIYVAGDSNGLLIIDAANPISPEVIGKFDTFQAMDVAVADSVIYLAAGEEGVYILRDVSNGQGTGSTGSDIENPIDVSRTEAELVSVAPNPFAGSAIVRYRTTKTGRIRIVLYDLLGRLVAVLLDEISPLGEHAFRWDTPPLPNGKYFVTLEEGGRGSIAVSLVR